MLTMEENLRFRNMSPEERSEELLNSTSDAVRDMAKKLAMLKAIAHVENGVAPEDFDKAWEREFRKAWDKVKNKTGQELAVMALLDMMAGGADIEKILGVE